MELHPSLLFLGGLVVIVLGAELLLRGATRLATLLGVPPVIIGLTVVTVGTTMPELAVGVTAALEGNSGLAVGNIAGTNVFNILVILGLSAVVRPLPLHLLSFKLDVPVMIGAALMLIVMAWDGVLARADGLLLLIAALSYTLTLVLLSRRESQAVRREFAEEYGRETILSSKDAALHSRWARGLWFLALLAAGVAITLLGAELLVSGAVRLARAFGVSDEIIGLTIVAVGTSAPELATTLVATIKDERDVAIGNLVGSCIYNILVILGVAGVVAPDGVQVSREVLWIDLPLAAAVALLMLPVFRTGDSVSRREGSLFVGIYLLYLLALLGWRV
jgi:cation:H+ antiporter